MAISLVVIAKVYASGAQNLVAYTTPGQHLGEKRAQFGERKR